MKTKTIIITGKDLTLQDIYAIVHDSTILLTVHEATLKNIDKTKKFLDQEFEKKVIYGVNTGFGPMASHMIGRDEIKLLQENLIRGHSMGMGNPLPSEYVLAAMVVRLNTLAKGYSGVSRELVKRLELFINKRIIPMVPEHGAVGTSGDLVQLAHIALALIGGGEVFYRGKREKTKNVLKRLKILPYVLKEKEGLSLINGTSMMSGIAALVCVEAKRLIGLSVQVGAFSLESVGAFTDGISEVLNALRPHRGQQAVARTLREILASSRLMKSREEFQKKVLVEEDAREILRFVQEIYSLRCVPQIIGPILDTLVQAWGEISIEINSVTDNPIIDRKNKTFLHGGNFHGDYISAAMDKVKISLVKLMMLSERHTNFFLNVNVNKHFPPFLNLRKVGLNMGLQGLQFVATSTTAQSQTLAFPQYVHSIPTNGDNQDIVSMGTDSALFAARVVENAYIVLAIELVTLAQVVDYSGGTKSYSLSSQKLFKGVRAVFPAVTVDREAAQELVRVVQYAKRSQIVDMI